MWEDFSIALSCVGFVAAAILTLVELRVLLGETAGWLARGGQHHRVS